MTEVSVKNSCFLLLRGFYFKQCSKEWHLLKKLCSGANQLIGRVPVTRQGQVVHVTPWERIMKEPLYSTARCLMTWSCGFSMIFSSTWLFRESGPDANSRDSPEAPGCFGHLWTVSLDLDWDCLNFVGLDSWCSSEYSWIYWDSLANSLTNSLIDWCGVILSDWFDFALFSWSGGRSEDTRQTERLTDRQTKGWKDSWVQHWASLKALTF